MQRDALVGYWTRIVPIALLVAGIAAIGIAFTGDVLGLGGGSGFGPNQVSLALSGFALLAAGVILVSSGSQRDIGQWLLIGVAVIAITIAADLLVLGGLAGFGAKHVMLASVAAGLGLTTVAPARSGRRDDVAGRLNLLPTMDIVKPGKFVSIALQLGLLVLVVRQYELENQAFYTNIMLLTFYGFLIHYFLPLRYRLSFFLLLSLAAIAGVLGLANGAWLVAIGLGLIGICHLPIPFSFRVAFLVAAGVGLAFLRIEGLQMPIPGVIWPILGSMFMFRLIIYLYDLRHSKEPVSISRSLAYFFLLPNVVFPFFPVVDFATFRRTYYNEERYGIYQRGVEWMLRGVFQLIVYRFVNYYVVIATEDVSNAVDLARFAISNFLLYLRVSGQFHLIVGILHLYGFNLPETNHRYLLASSFMDLWRRINIYWKEFMLKIFFYPTHFKLGKMKATSRLVVATAVVFIMTWFLHAYQWFWLRGSFLLTAPDIVFWTILALLVIANTLYEARRGRKRTLGNRSQTLRDVLFLALRTAGTFSLLTFLWSLWTSESIREWISLWSVATTLEGIATLALIFLAITAVMGVTIWIGNVGTKPRAADKIQQPKFFKAAATNGLYVVLLLLIGTPAVYTRIGGQAQEIITDLRAARLSDRDAELLQRGYYEDLMGVNRFNSELWDVYSKRPTEWPLIQETEVARLTGDFYLIELMPSTRIFFHGEEFTTNRWGMRDIEYEQIPAPGTYRIAVLGPSFVMGSGVADDDVFVSLLEERLNLENDKSTYDSYELLNFGVAGYSVLQELAVWEQRAMTFEPITLFLVAHQLEKEIAIRNLANSIKNGHDIPYEYLHEIAQQAEVDATMPAAEIERRLKPFGRELVSWAYHHIAELARENDVLPVWVFMSTLETSFSEEETADLISLAEEAGFVVLDLSRIYENQDVASLIVAEWDKHPNAKGSRLIADSLYQALREKEDLIPLGLPVESTTNTGSTP
jgi:hypothetical protein